MELYQKQKQNAPFLKLLTKFEQNKKQKKIKSCAIIIKHLDQPLPNQLKQSLDWPISTKSISVDITALVCLLEVKVDFNKKTKKTQKSLLLFQHFFFFKWRALENYFTSWIFLMSFKVYLVQNYQQLAVMNCSSISLHSQKMLKMRTDWCNRSQHFQH